MQVTWVHDLRHVHFSNCDHECCYYEQAVLSCFSHVLLSATPWTVACQAPLSMGCSRQGHWSGVPFPPLGDLTDPGMEPVSLMRLEPSGGFYTTSATWEAPLLS